MCNTEALTSARSAESESSGDRGSKDSQTEEGLQDVQPTVYRINFEQMRNKGNKHKQNVMFLSTDEEDQNNDALPSKHV